MLWARTRWLRLFTLLGLIAVFGTPIYLRAANNTQTYKPDHTPAFQPRFGQSDAFIMEKWGDNPDQYSRIKIDLVDGTTSSDRSGKPKRVALPNWDFGHNNDPSNFGINDRILQICVTDPNCGDDTATAGNHLDVGTPVCGDWRNIDGCHGGEWTGPTTFWIKRHPQATRGFTRINIYTAFSSNNYQNIHRVTIYTIRKDIGWGNKLPLVEPRQGHENQLYVEWDDITRWLPDENGHITADWFTKNVDNPRLGPEEQYSPGRSGRKEDSINWVYRIYYTDNPTQDPADWTNHPIDSGSDYLVKGGRTYLANVPGITQTPETELHIRTRFRVRRNLNDNKNQHVNTLVGFSKPARFFVPKHFDTVTQTQDGIKATWTNSYTDEIDRYEYRIGHTEGDWQTLWTTTNWIEACTEDLTDEGTNQKALIITGDQTVQGQCGPNILQTLDLTKQYRIQIRAIDESRTDNQIVRNYTQQTRLQLTDPPPTPTTTPPSTAAPSTTPTTQPTATTPSTAAPTTQPTTPTQTQPTTPGSTQPPATTPTTQPPVPPATQAPINNQPINPGPVNPPNPNTGGSNPNINLEVEGDNNTVIIGDSNIIFTDTSESVHEQNIIQLADMGVTRGCNPPTNTRFCPDRAVTRAEMATFLTRAFELAPTDQDPFEDTTGNVHRTNINRMAAAGISRGCNPPTNDRFCPDRAVTRAEMATFMTRTLQLEQEGTGFDDTTGNVHATNIQRFAEAGITRGCNPPTNTRYCPDRAVTRAEMATFLVRSVNLNIG